MGTGPTPPGREAGGAHHAIFQAQPGGGVHAGNVEVGALGHLLEVELAVGGSRDREADFGDLLVGGFRQLLVAEVEVGLGAGRGVGRRRLAA